MYKLKYLLVTWSGFHYAQSNCIVENIDLTYFVTNGFYQTCFTVYGGDWYYPTYQFPYTFSIPLCGISQSCGHFNGNVDQDGYYQCGTYNPYTWALTNYKGNNALSVQYSSYGGRQSIVYIMCGSSASTVVENPQETYNIYLYTLNSGVCNGLVGGGSPTPFPTFSPTSKTWDLESDYYSIVYGGSLGRPWQFGVFTYGLSSPSYRTPLIWTTYYSNSYFLYGGSFGTSQTNAGIVWANSAFAVEQSINPLHVSLDSDSASPYVSWTCPSSGTYTFSITFSGQSAKNVYLAGVIYFKQSTGIYTFQSTYYNSVSNTMTYSSTLNMLSGDIVLAYVSQNYGSGNTQTDFTVTTANSVSSPVLTSSSSSNSSSNAGLAIGVSVAVIVFVCITAAAAFYYWRREKLKKAVSNQDQDSISAGAEFGRVDVVKIYPPTSNRESTGKSPLTPSAPTLDRRDEYGGHAGSTRKAGGPLVAELMAGTFMLGASAGVDSVDVEAAIARRAGASQNLVDTGRDVAQLSTDAAVSGLGSVAAIGDMASVGSDLARRAGFSDNTASTGRDITQLGVDTASSGISSAASVGDLTSVGADIGAALAKGAGVSEQTVAVGRTAAQLASSSATAVLSGDFSSIGGNLAQLAAQRAGLSEETAKNVNAATKVGVQIATAFCSIQ